MKNMHRGPVIRGADSGRRGFTLLEMVITVVVIGIVLVIAMPTFTTWMNKQRVHIEAEQISGLMQRARIRAVARATPIRVELSLPATATLKVKNAGAWTTEESAVLSPGLELKEPLPQAVLFFQPNGLVTRTENNLLDLIDDSDYDIKDTGYDYTVRIRVLRTGLVIFCGEAGPGACD